MRLDFKIVEIRATENNPRVRRRRDKPQFAVNSRMKPDPIDGDGLLDRGLKGHSPKQCNCI